MEMHALLDTMAAHAANDALVRLDEIGLPADKSIRWLYGLAAGLYFADGDARRTREAMRGLALRYYDLAEGNTNVLAFDGGSKRLGTKQVLVDYFDQPAYLDASNTAGFYLRHRPKGALRSGEPVHDYFTTLLPCTGYRGGNGRLLYQTRLAELARDPAGVVRFFVDACRELRVFYAVSGLSLLFATYASSAPERAHPVLCRFPGLLYEDGTHFGMEIRHRTDAIRDVNWLTAIDDALLARVGGLDAARAALGDAVVLHPYDGGVVFQAGAMPVLGDLDNGGAPAAYRAVNAFLRPLRLAHWERPYLRVPHDVDEMAFTDWWTRRFDEEAGGRFR
ncbi:type VI immunity family protein [Xanthomonas sp. XNM01]|uniref:type VI immunity family protein n=1 Tax=Xanthomonas sp. XNM01 TaxID=2769289 RepID=UPI0017841C8E|nr:type VI immunity family protein [Xanthomonas sp. XNM01]MBD9370388.1 DUF3396 domain-containing protein [Xanthomonas sp. XNM01]